MATLDKLRAAGVPDTRSIEVQYDAPEFKRGIHTLAEIRRSCAQVERLGKIQAFERWAILAMKDKLCLLLWVSTWYFLDDDRVAAAAVHAAHCV